jgi:hypothetical protein
MPIEPLRPVDTALEIGAWDEIVVSWDAPYDDGGSAVDKYRVEWWSAETGLYGVGEIQTLKFAGDINAGEWYLESPQGERYHSALPWNVTSLSLELALESFDDVGDVTVVYTPDSGSGFRTYRVEFLTNLGDVGDLFIDKGSLSALNGNTNAVTCTDADVTTECAAVDSVAGTATLTSPPPSDGPGTAGGFSESVSLDIAEGARYTYTIRNVQQVSTTAAGFSVRVFAHTAGGYGLPSLPLTLKPMAVPEPPGRAMVKLVAGSPTSLRIHWTDVTTDTSTPYGLIFGNRASDVDGYLVEWSTDPTFPDVDAEAETDAAAAAAAAADAGSIIRDPGYFASPRVYNQTTGKWFEHVITGLQQGRAYYVRVSARNTMSVGPARATTPAYEVPRTAPSQHVEGPGVVLSTIPASESVTVTESTQSLLVEFTPTPNDRGDKVMDYLVEWWRAEDPGLDEVQVIKTDASTQISGTFVVGYAGASTDSLPFDVTEEEMELALEGLPQIRDVQVTRSNASSYVGYEWCVTFLSEVPASVDRQLTIDGNGLSAPGGGLSAKVGYDLQENLPGHKGQVEVGVTQGQALVTIVSGSAAEMEAGQYIRLAKAVYRIGTVAAGTLTLTTPYEGLSDANLKPCDYGVSVPGSAAMDMASAQVDVFDVSVLAKGSYTITGLKVGVKYAVRLSSRNDRGLSLPQMSEPASLAPPPQKPSVPSDVRLSVHSDTSLRVLFNAPDDDGGVTVTKYKVEWDTSPQFTSGLGGTVLGSHHKVLVNAVGACLLTPCEYIVSGLTNGVSYYVRVFAYNSHGFSVDGAPTTPPLETPCTQAAPPTMLSVTPANATSLQVGFLPSADDGGCAISMYKLEWDAAGGLGYVSGGVSGASLLYSNHEVQVVTVRASKNDLGGTYRLAFQGHSSSEISASASASEMEAALQLIPTVGGVTVTRSQMVAAGKYGLAYSVTFTGQAGSVASDQWIGDVATLTASTDASQYPSQFLASASGNKLKGTDALVSVDTAVDGYRGFEEQLVQVHTSAGSLKGTYRLKYGAESTVPLPWNASSVAVEAALLALNPVGTQSLYVARTIANGLSSGGPDSGMEWRIVFTSAAGNVPLVGIDSRGLRSTDYSSSVVATTSVVNVGYTPTMDSSVRRELVLSGADLTAADADPEGLIRATVPYLESGEAYHVRVSAFNGIGNSYGKARYSTPAVTVPSQPPQAPTRVSAAASSDQSIKITWAPPLDDGGVAVSSYNVEWDSHSGVMAQQVITQTGAHSGTFRLTFDGATTKAIPFDATELQLEHALTALQTVGSVQVSRAELTNDEGGAKKNGKKGSKATAGFSWTVAFLDNVGDVSLLEAPAGSRNLRPASASSAVPAINVRSLVQGSKPPFDQGTVGIYTLPLGSAKVSAAHEVQRITVEAAAADTFTPLGTFIVSFEGHTSIPISPTATASEVKKALEGILTIGAVSVTSEDIGMTSTPPNILLPGSHARRWTVTFDDSAVDVPSMLVSTQAGDVGTRVAGGTLGGSAPAVYVETLSQGGPVNEFTTPPTLSAGTQYFVRVSADNGRGTSAFADAPFAVLTAQQPPGAPEDVVVVRISDKTLGVSWSAPKLDGGAVVTRYSLMWSVDTSFGGDAGRVEVDADPKASDSDGRFSHLINGLNDKTVYFIQVLSYNRVGYSQPAAATPLGTNEEIQSVVLTSTDGSAAPLSGATFVLTYTDVNTGRSQTTSALPGTASAGEVADAIQALPNCGAVRVMRYDQSTDPIGGGAQLPFTLQVQGGTYAPTVIKTSGTTTLLQLGVLGGGGLGPFTRTTYATAPATCGSAQAGCGASAQKVKLYSDTNVAAGLLVSGPGVAAGTTVTGVATSTKTVTLSHALKAPLETFTAGTAVGQTSPSGVTTLGLAAPNSKIRAGMSVTASGFLQAGTTVVSYGAGGYALELSKPTLNNVDGETLTFQSVITFESNQIKLSSLTQVVIGMEVSGPGIPMGTKVTNTDNTGPVFGLVILSAPLTKDLVSSDTLTLMATELQFSSSTHDVQLGQVVSGTNIPLGTRVTSILSGNKVALSKGATGTLSSATLTFTTTTDSYDSTAIDTAVAQLEYVLTFVGPEERRAGDLNILSAAVTAGGAQVTAGVSEVQKGMAAATGSISPRLTVPSVPTELNLTVISTSELGVYWNAPVQTGGLAVTKYLVEWDVGATGSALSRSAATVVGTYAQAMAFSQVVAAPVTQYQIVGLLENHTYYVRVSAYNAAGYSPPRRTTPIFAVPAPQIPHKPTHVSMRLSSPGSYVSGSGFTGAVDPRSPGQLPDQLDLSWVRPVEDASTRRFATTDGGSKILGYLVEWDTDSDFRSLEAGATGQATVTASTAGTYDIRAVQTDGSPLPCTQSNCSFPLGAEVQVLRVYGGGGDPLTAGAYTLSLRRHRQDHRLHRLRHCTHGTRRNGGGAGGRRWRHSSRLEGNDQHPHAWPRLRVPHHLHRCWRPRQRGTATGWRPRGPGQTRHRAQNELYGVHGDERRLQPGNDAAAGRAHNGCRRRLPHPWNALLHSDGRAQRGRERRVAAVSTDRLRRRLRERHPRAAPRVGQGCGHRRRAPSTGTTGPPNGRQGVRAARRRSQVARAVERRGHGQRCSCDELRHRVHR